MAEGKHSSEEINNNNEDGEEDYEPPANTMEELLFRELAVLKLGVSRHQKIPFTLRYSEECGRGMIATRNIKRGEVIVEESPAVWGPKATNRGASCLECASPITDLSRVIFCPECNLHFCSTACSKSPAHIRECKAMKSLNISTTITMDNLSKLTLVILVLRCILLPDTAPENWARLRLLQDHLETRKDSQIHLMNKEFIIPFLREIGLDKAFISDLEIQRVCGILESNAFEIKGGEDQEGRAVFPLCSMVNSSCLPNLTHMTRPDRSMVMLASRDIKKGDELLICYTGIRWGRLARRKHLLVTKCFLCCCPRCQDPTESGTFISAMRCSDCEGNMVQQIAGEASEAEDAAWKCIKCNAEMPHKKVLAMEAMIGQMLKMINKKSPPHLEGVSRKLRRWLSPHHYILLEIYMSLISLYQARNEKPERVEELCNVLLPILTTLEGESRVVAQLRCWRISAKVTQYQEGQQVEEVPLEWVDQAIKQLKEALPLLKNSVEGSENIDEIKQRLENLRAKDIK